MKSSQATGSRYATIPSTVIKRIPELAVCRNLYLTEIGYEEATPFCPTVKAGSESGFLLVYVVSGEGTYRVKQKTFTATENDYFVLPASQAKYLSSQVTNPWTIFWAFFLGRNAQELATYLMSTDPAPKKAKPLVGRVAQFNDILHHLELMENMENLVYANSRFYSFLCSFKLDVLSAKKHGKKDKVIHTIEYMRENIGKAITLQELADLAGLSVSHYSAQFKLKTAQAPMQLYTTMKVQRACQWLQNGNLTIKAIAYNLGFFDQYHFSKVFKEIMGISPRAFRGRQPKK